VKRAIAPLLTLALVVVVGFAAWQGQRSEREFGIRDAAIRASEARVIVLERVADSLRRAYRTDTVRLWRSIRALDTLTVTVDQWKHDTVRVVEYVRAADETARACTRAVATCEERLKVADSLRIEAEGQRDTLRKQERRPWTSVGLEYDGRLGGYLERDWWRFRAGISVTPAPQDARVGIRLGIRW
jgi:hypothetical protein